MKIAVLMGGISGEREVSLHSGAQVARALREAGHDVLAVDTSRGVLSAAEEAALLSSGIREPTFADASSDLLRTGDPGFLTGDPALAGTELVFPALHGGGGEDGTLQTLLDLARIPYAGSGRVGCALAMDKDLSKRIFRDAGIPVPPWIMAEGREQALALAPEALAALGSPLIVKPPSGGSTLGLSLVRDAGEMEGAVDLSLRYEPLVMFESYVRGRELTVGILGTGALPVGEIIPAHELFDYECKYQPGMAQEIFPAELPEEVASRVRDMALRAHRALGLRDFSRVDFILDGDGVPWCLEANALPGLTNNSLLPKAAGAAGITFPELCHRIAVMAHGRGMDGGNPSEGVGV